MKITDGISVETVSADVYRLNFDRYQHSLFVTPEWVGAIEDGNQALFLHFEQNGQVVAKLAGIIEKGSWLTRRFLFLYAGPALIFNNRELYDACMAALLWYARKNHITKIEMQNYDQQHNWACRSEGYFKRGMAEYVKHFDATEQMPHFSKSVMYNVRKANRVNPVFVEETSERALNKLHELLSATSLLRQDHYGKYYIPYPYHLMTKESTDRLFKTGLMRLYCVMVDGEIHCVRCAIENNKRMFGLMIAADAFAYSHGLQHFMQYNIISQLHAKGYKYYNIAGISPLDEGPGLAEYKESLGCKPQHAYGVYTRFITFPQNMLNPVMNVGKLMSKSEKLKVVSYKLSRFVTTGHF